MWTYTKNQKSNSIHHQFTMNHHISKKSISKEIVEDDKKIKPAFRGVVTRRRYKHILEAVDTK